MKEYFGYPADGAASPRVGYRIKGSKPVNLVMHTISAKHATFDWGIVSVPTTNLSRSLLLDAFGTDKCGNYPNKCRCTNKWVPDRAVSEFEQKIVVPRFINKEIFKIGQLEICDFAFEVLDNIKNEPEVNIDVELEPLTIKEPELIQ